MTADLVCANCKEIFEDTSRCYRPRKFCSMPCYRAGQIGVPKRRRFTELERFWRKVDKSGGPDSCWIWLGFTDRNKYGKFDMALPTSGTKSVYAHRFSWELVNGPIPTGDHHGTMCVLHRCDNPSCCNPSHLFIGTHKDNMYDCIAKGRWRLGKYNVPSKDLEEDSPCTT